MTARGRRLPPPPFPDASAVRPQLRTWLASLNFVPFPFQETVWAAQKRGESGLLHMPTGAGKTYAAYLGALAEVAELRSQGAAPATRLIYITPLRALSRDVEKALRRPVDELQWPLTVASRTGDTSSYARAKLRDTPADILVTTPESLALLLANDDAPERLKELCTIVVDEWHELLGTKRGSLLELTLSRIRGFAPEVKTWALSATLANVEEAARAACGLRTAPTIVTHPMERPMHIDTLLPPEVDRFPWAGHLGLKMLSVLLTELDPAVATLVFTNTRFQAERWFQALRFALGEKPEWAERIALHHGSLDREERERVEAGVKEGLLRLVVCTSSLDLGVDLYAVERVFQIGSPKALGRIVQRAGRSGHRPGAACRITFVPTHALELLEIAATRQALAAGAMEARRPLDKPLDVLAQHAVTSALGAGFREEELFAQVRETIGFQSVTEAEFAWTLALVTRGGSALGAYPQYRRIYQNEEGSFRPSDNVMARRHRMNIGTIVSDASVVVRFASGGTLGTVEESYVSRLHRGDRFVFAGRVLELVRLRDMIAHVKLAKKGSLAIPRWSGGKLPLSQSLASAVRSTLATTRETTPAIPELQTLEPILSAQRRLSAIPSADEVLLEVWRERDGTHLFVYPFEGRSVHEGLAALLAFRFARHRKASFSLSANDYGLELFCPADFPFEEILAEATPSVFSRDNLTEDVLGSLNLGELSRRQFREIARIAGLTMHNHSGSAKTSRQLQASSGLLFDVLQRYEPESLLLAQAQKEVLEGQFQRTRFASALERLENSQRVVRELAEPTPLAFPLVIERVGARLSSETLADRVERMKRQWDKPTTKRTG